MNTPGKSSPQFKIMKNSVIPKCSKALGNPLLPTLSPSLIITHLLYVPIK